VSGAIGVIATALERGELEVTRLAEGSAVLLHVPSLRSRMLNPSGVALLDAVAAGTADEEALAHALRGAYGIDADAAARDIRAFLTALAAFLQA
jgi:hypothetical protein